MKAHFFLCLTPHFILFFGVQLEFGSVCLSGSDPRHTHLASPVSLRHICPVLTLTRPTLSYLTVALSPFARCNPLGLSVAGSEAST